MTDAVSPLSAKAKLALSRAELLAAMGYEELHSAVDDGTTVVPLLHHDGRETASGLGAKLARSAVGRWWHRHPLSGALELGQPLLQDYAHRKPVTLVVYGAGAGALLWILKPWRLLSAATVATLILRNVDVAGMVSGLVRKAGDLSGAALPPVSLPTSREPRRL
ncbi:hypothetical protein WKW79_35885 [Variovorax robiniae]|uniref:Uncharacterized protein n=1 Tax=Variovorax robiniae TaxID=1836199 RepID=A0ABU8XJD0_9BURK